LQRAGPACPSGSRSCADPSLRRSSGAASLTRKADAAPRAGKVIHALFQPGKSRRYRENHAGTAAERAARPHLRSHWSGEPGRGRGRSMCGVRRLKSPGREIPDRTCPFPSSAPRARSRRSGQPRASRDPATVSGALAALHCPGVLRYMPSRHSGMTRPVRRTEMSEAS
jgi:hypothetical protein